jgi:small subunit ribosomal protein S16
MVKIRLFRVGTHKRPMYRIVAMDHRKKRQGRTLEQLGTYDPVSGGTVTLREDALEKWLSRGAQPSDTVASLVRRHKRQASAAAAAEEAQA